MALNTAEAWGVAIAGILGLVLALNQLGVDVPSAISSAIHGTEQLLNHPLL
ncbi:MAG TPA: hypothetical protein VMI55_04200 [Thermoplasmata archaeon]|jgi:hypothetical protein|nr:hypothetical protein [Thermoplasmata archaeon]